MTKQSITEFVFMPATKKSLGHRKSVHGVGINDADYIVSILVNGSYQQSPVYTKWASMLARCYSKGLQKKRPTYIGCSVCKEWLTFSNFRRWMEEQDWEGKDLDKDILAKGNRIYSPGTCIFVNPEINAIFKSPVAKEHSLPLGVAWHKRNLTYTAQYGTGGKLVHLGSFDTPDKAESAYKKFKSRHVIGIALQQEGRLRTALIGRAQEIAA